MSYPIRCICAKSLKCKQIIFFVLKKDELQWNITWMLTSKTWWITHLQRMHKSMLLFCLLKVLSFIYPCFIVSRLFRGHRFIHKTCIQAKSWVFSSAYSFLNPEHCQIKFLLLSPMIIRGNYSELHRLYLCQVQYLLSTRKSSFSLTGRFNGKGQVFYYYYLVLCVSLM